MSDTNQNENISNNSLLESLLLAPIPKRRLKLQIFISLLSHSAWEGINGIVSIASLLVTVILTWYIFDLSRQQQSAQIEYGYLLEENQAENQAWFIDKSPNLSEQIQYKILVSIYNRGPASAQGVSVSIHTNFGEITDCLSIQDEIYNAKAEKINIGRYRNTCELFYTDFYPSQRTYVLIKLQSKPRQIISSITGANISKTTNTILPSLLNCTVYEDLSVDCGLG